MKRNTHLLAQGAISPARGGSGSTPRSAPRRSSGSVNRVPSRSTRSSSSGWPAWNWKSIASRSRWPLIARTRSPRVRPAAAAAVRGRMRATTTPVTSADTGVVMGGVALRTWRGAEKLHPLHEVLEAGDHRERGGEPEDEARDDRHVQEAREEPRQHGEDLEERRGLARPRRPRMDTRAEHVDEQRADDQDHVAAQHDGRDPEREHLEVGEGHERRREQELVGDRVEERAEAALAPLATGDPAVEQVGQGGDRKDDERCAGLPVDEERDENRDQEDPQNRQPVGETHGRAAQSASPREAAGASTTYGASRPRRRAANSTSSRTASGSSARASTRPCS